MLKKTTLLFLIASYLFSNSIFAQEHQLLSKKLDSLLIDKAVRPFNGVVLITQKGKTVYSKVHGYADMNKKTPLPLNSQFEIMSNSKQITAVLILKEAEKGRINLQSPIKKHLSYLSQPWADSVTVHQLLNHTHGIIDTGKPLLFKSGTDFKYGNLSYILLGQIIEHVTKKSYEEIANALFKQLNMKQTLCYSKDKTKNLVSGHYNTNNTFEVMTESQINAYSMPADGIVTSARDLTKWDELLHHGKILNQASYKLMTSYTTLGQHNVFGNEKIGYGYGIRIHNLSPVKYLGHTGLGDGFASMNLYFPESETSVIVLENQMNNNMDLNYYFETEIRKLFEGFEMKGRNKN